MAPQMTYDIKSRLGERSKMTKKHYKHSKTEIRFSRIAAEN